MTHRKSPYLIQASPIMKIYQQSKKRSLSYQQSHSSSQRSYQQFKVKNIINALANNHIIHKSQHYQKEKMIQRQRSLSKVYGATNIKKSTYSSPYDEGSYFNIKSPSTQIISDFKTLINIKQKQNFPMMQQDMCYQSAYTINNDKRQSRRNSINSVNSSSKRSKKQKNSFFLNTEGQQQQQNLLQRQIIHKLSNFVRKKSPKQDMDEQQTDYIDENYQNYYTLQKNKKNSFKKI